MSRVRPNLPRETTRQLRSPAESRSVMMSLAFLKVKGSSPRSPHTPHKQRTHPQWRALACPSADRLPRALPLPVGEGHTLINREECNLFFRFVANRYEKASTIITSNKAFSDWTELFHDPVIVTAILDRLLHHSTVINIRGNSYRLMGKTTHEVLGLDQDTGKSGSVFTTENGSLLKDH
jgi:hypothetical protein